jgi:hypothetical protein
MRIYFSDPNIAIIAINQLQLYCARFRDQKKTDRVLVSGWIPLSLWRNRREALVVNDII